MVKLTLTPHASRWSRPRTIGWHVRWSRVTLSFSTATPSIHLLQTVPRSLGGRLCRAFAAATIPARKTLSSCRHGAISRCSNVAASSSQNLNASGRKCDRNPRYSECTEMNSAVTTQRQWPPSSKASAAGCRKPRPERAFPALLCCQASSSSSLVGSHPGVSCCRTPRVRVLAAPAGRL